MFSRLKIALKNYRFVIEPYQKFIGVDPNFFLLGMTNMKERSFWEFYGEKLYTGEGEIIDLGCWFGSTTTPLLRGLLKNKKFKKSKRKVYAYDLFIWEDWMAEFTKNTKFENKYKQGDNFIEAFREATRLFGKHIEVRAGDITKTFWGKKPIEFLLIDAMKSWELANSIQQNFYSSLIPGKSIIVHQDYSHYYTYWIHLLQFRFREYFELVEDIEQSGSTVFRLQKTIPNSLLQQQHCVQDFSEEEITNAFNFSLSLSKEVNQGSVLAAKVMCILDKYGKDFAQKEFTKIALMGIKNSDIDIVQAIVFK